MPDLAILLVVGIVALLILGGFVLGALALTRIRRLERRLRTVETAFGARPGVTVPPIQTAVSVAVPEGPKVPPVAAAAPTLPRTPKRARDWEAAIAGRWLNRLGLFAVTVGISYFLKYAIDNDWVGPRGQVAAGLVIGAAIVALSTRFVKRGLGYFADGLTGLGAAVLYMSLWGGTSYYGFVSLEVGFAAMAVVTIAMLTIALGRDSRTVAMLALLGGFLTPWLVSTGTDAEVTLFTYLAVHNAALIALARARSWRLVELPAFVFTQIYFWGWAGEFYTDAALAPTAVFAALFFAEFSVLPILRVRRTATSAPEHTLLVLLNAAAVFLTFASILGSRRWDLTLVALALSVVHLMLARAVPARAPREAPVRLLFGGLALAFATLAIPIRLEGAWVTFGLAIEAGVLAWTGFSAHLRFPRVVAYLLLAVIGARLLNDPPGATRFLFNVRLATALVVCASACLPVWLVARSPSPISHTESVVATALAIGANFLLLWAMTMEVDLYFDISPGRLMIPVDVLLARSLTISLLWTTYATALLALGVRVQSARLRWQGLALFGITALKVFSVDLGYLSGFYRIASSVALGLVLLAVSFLYQRALPRRTSQETSS